MIEDSQLLRRFVAERSQSAFAELVRRHVNLVYFAALRRVGGDQHLADDVTQSVFSDLARKAASLQDRAVLTGWLYTSTRFAAAQAVRTERRRRTHEQEAHTMHTLHDAPTGNWDQVRPVIDEAMDELSESEREAVLLRFFENLPLAEVGARFSVSADAARMRVDRALDKLRSQLAKRGIASTSAALVTVLAAQSAVAAPSGMALKIVAGALNRGGVGALARLKLGTTLAIGGAAILATGVVAYSIHASRSSGAEFTGGLESYEPVAVAPAESPPPPVEATTPAPAAAAAPLPPAPQSAGAQFSPFTGMQKIILKRLWDHEQISADPPGRRWAFRMSNGAPRYLEFEGAASVLSARGLVRVNPLTGFVGLTPRGRLFCARHTREIDGN